MLLLVSAGCSDCKQQFAENYYENLVKAEAVCKGHGQELISVYTNDTQTFYALCKQKNPEKVITQQIT